MAPTCRHEIDVYIVDVYNVDCDGEVRMIGKLEELTLLSTLRAGENAMASRIYDELVTCVGKDEIASFGAVYTTLTRMAGKGFLIQTRFKDNNGKNRFAFTVSPSGRSALNQSMSSIHRLGGFAIAGAF